MCRVPRTSSMTWQLAGHERDGRHCRQEPKDKLCGEQTWLCAQRHHDAGKHEDVLDGMIEPGNGNVGSKAIRSFYA